LGDSADVNAAAMEAGQLRLAVATAGHDIAPDWMIGIVAGLGGLCGGYLGALLQPFLPEKALRAALGFLAIATSVIYAIQALC
jgi:uncharacterized protein